MLGFVCIQTGQWNLGGTPLQYAKSLSDETDGLIEIYCLEALVNHSYVSIKKTFQSIDLVKVIGKIPVYLRVFCHKTLLLVHTQISLL